MFIPTGELWLASSVNACLPPIPKLDRKGRPVMNKKKGVQRTMPATMWLDQNAAVQQLTWAPGKPTIIRDYFVNNGGWINHPGAACFNLYLSPLGFNSGNANGAGLWTQHIHRIYPDDAEHIIKWFAHRVQYPGDKINHCLMLGGEQGIGKDTLLEPVKRAVGSWNFAEISPSQMTGRFNGFLRSVIVRINEARDLGEVNRYSFYEHYKTITASPPDVLRIDEKNIREHSIFNCCGILVTTNHKTDGMYLPSGDRRTYVAWSNCVRSDFSESYWADIWKWYNSGGDADVAAYLSELDLSSFNSKAPPPHTEAFYAIVMAGHAPEQSEMADCLDRLDNLPAVTLEMLAEVADPDFADWLTDRKNRRAIPFKLETAGYVQARNAAAKDGYWSIKGRRQVIYASQNLPLNQQQIATRDLIRDLEAGKSFKRKNTGKSTIHPFPGPKPNR
jgi:hypothetical protein